MTPALLAAEDAQLAAVLEHVGEVADYRVGGTATAVAVVVTVAEFADDTPGRPYGRDRVRLADMLLRTAAIDTIEPAHADTLTITAGVYAGTWNVLGVERREPVATVVRVRRSERLDSAAPGAREVRR